MEQIVRAGAPPRRRSPPWRWMVLGAAALLCAEALTGLLMAGTFEVSLPASTVTALSRTTEERASGPLWRANQGVLWRTVSGMVDHLLSTSSVSIGGIALRVSSKDRTDLAEALSRLVIERARRLVENPSPDDASVIERVLAAELARTRLSVRVGPLVLPVRIIVRGSPD